MQSRSPGRRVGSMLTPDARMRSSPNERRPSRASYTCPADGVRGNIHDLESGQEFLRNVRQLACTPLVFPQASAVVSKARSKRNSGLRYGFLAEERAFSWALSSWAVRSLGVIAFEALTGSSFPAQTVAQPDERECTTAGLGIATLCCLLGCPNCDRKYKNLISKRTGCRACGRDGRCGKKS